MYKSKKVIMLEYIPLRILMEIISFSPYIFVVLFAKLIGALMYYLVPSARKVALINLKQAFPEKTYRERKRIAKRSMKSMIITFAEFIKSIGNIVNYSYRRFSFHSDCHRSYGGSARIIKKVHKNSV